MRLGPDWRSSSCTSWPSLGHLGIWDAKNDAAIIIDAALEKGIYDREGNPAAAALLRRYRLPKTIRKLHSMLPGHLLTSHYQPACGMRTPLTSSTAHSISPCESNGWSAKG